MNILTKYCNELNRHHKTGKAREHTYRPAIINLFENFKSIELVSNENARVECGAPDITVFDKELCEIGYIETKDIGISLEKELVSNQLERYRKALDNLILTDYLTFYFIQDGSVSNIISIAKIKNGQIVLADEETQKTFLSYCHEFSSKKIKKIKSSNDLAIRMANSAIIIKDGIKKAFKDQRYNSSFEEQLAAFKEILIENLDQEKFSDLYAQTVVYGLFVARCFSGAEPLTRQNASFMLPKTNPFLRKIFNYLAGPELDDRLSWIVENVVSLFNKCDFDHIYSELTSSTRSNDPVVDFYEIFLKHFDPEQKKRLGVYYTPAPAVKYIIKSVDKILKSEFKIEDGIASTDKVSSDGKESDKVILLDPATGTGTFLLEAIKFIKDKFKDNEGLWDSYVSKNLLKRIFGFEILMAPYTVAHLKLGIELKKLGYKFKDEERLNVYLTNTLEETRDITNMFPFAKWLTEESSNAKKVKKEHPIMVVLGNPPYSGESSNNGDWIKNLLHGKDIDTGKTTESYFHLNGAPLEEKNTKWLNDDYVKFMRFAQWRIDNTGYGVMAFITNHGFIDNPTFRGMRESLLKDFDKIFVLDLHGNTKKKEKTPDGLPDKNIFDIQQGVSINFFVKNNTKKTGEMASVYHADLWDDKREIFDDNNILIGGKYHWLLNNDIDSTEWTKIVPKYPFLYLNPNETTHDEEYDDYFKITDIFPVNSVGIATARDDLTIHNTKNEVWDTVNEFVSREVEDAREYFKIKSDVRDWKVHLAQEDLVQSGPVKNNIIKVYYRPLDTRYTYYTGKSKGFHCMPRPEVMNNLVGKENIALVTSRMTKGERFNHHMVCDSAIDVISLSSKTSNNAFVFPLYTFSGKTRKINISEVFLKHIKQSMLNNQGTDEEIAKDIFYYITALLHSSEYKERYNYRLEKDFARIPLPPNKTIFATLAKMGEELSNSYLFKRPLSINSKFPVKGDNIVKDARYSVDEKFLYINDSQYFSNVDGNIWNYHIGGYQVLSKWLGYRKGKSLSFNDISELLKNIAILSELIKITSNIDIAIKKVGGFPFVGISSLSSQNDFIAAEKSTNSKEAKIPKVIEKRVALASYILNHSNIGQMTRTKFAKVFYLSDVVNNLDLKTKYKKEAAGPLDSTAWYNENVGIETLAEKRDIFKAHKTSNKFNYTLGKNIDSYSKKVSEMFSKEEIEGINNIISLTINMSTKKSELYATVYACWNDLIIQNNRQPAPSQIISYFYSWHDKKKKFEKEDIKKAIDYLKKIGLIPFGNNGLTG